MKNKKLIVFDMDDVLIDVSGSYRETVRQTARLFFEMAPSSEKLPQPLFSLADLAAVKQSGGLNNDWDLSCLVINLLFNQIEKPPVYESKDPWARYQETIKQFDCGVHRVDIGYQPKRRLGLSHGDHALYLQARQGVDPLRIAQRLRRL